MLMTEFGISTFISEEQLQKDLSPIVTTELGIVTLVTSEQPSKAFVDMETTVYVLLAHATVSGISISPTGFEKDVPSLGATVTVVPVIPPMYL